MTDSDHALTLRAAGQPGGAGERLDSEIVNRHLRRLAAAYPEFSFNYAMLGWKERKRWFAERTDRTAPGLRVVITTDLMELHAALQKDKECRRAR